MFLEDSRVIGLSEELEHEQHMLSDLDGNFHLSACRANVLADGDGSVQVLWTDGACKNNQDQRFRRAGSGIFYANSHPLNYSCLLPGLAQSNQRAELFAVLLACLRDPRPLDIRTDSEYVQKGVALWRSWHGSGWAGEHCDLWGLLAAELNSRANPVSVSWVKGHAKMIDVQRGRTTLLDKDGNDGADALAVAGAAQHAIDTDIVSLSDLRKKRAKDVHRMFIAIVRERRVQESCLNQALHDEVGDRGSDPGDCMIEVLDDDFDDTACACHDDVLLDECMESELTNLYATGTAAQLDMPKDTLVVEGCPDNMHEHVVQMNSLDDEFDMGAD